MTRREVRLLGIPVRPWLRLQEHTDALLRECRLVSQQGAAAPGELMRLFADLQATFPRSPVPALREAVKAVAGEGAVRVDARAQFDTEQAGSIEVLHRTLTAIDAYCRSGVLLTLPLEPELAALRAWVVEEVEGQLGGAEPRPYDGPLGR